MIRLENVSLSLGSSEILAGIDLEISQNELFVILGQSGSGKTSLLRVMAGLVMPTQGRLAVQSKKVGMIFQKNALFDSLTCGDNLRFPLAESLRLPQTEITARVTEMLARVQLPGVENLRVEELSGGMQKRLGIARASVLHPDILLCDEPTAGLDPITSVDILEMLHELKRKLAMTMVLVTSDISFAWTVATRVAFLHRGSLVQVGSPVELEEKPHPALKQFISGALEGPLGESL